MDNLSLCADYVAAMARHRPHAHVHDTNPALARLFIHTVIFKIGTTGSVHGLDRLIEFPTNSKTRTESIGITFGTVFGEHAASRHCDNSPHYSPLGCLALLRVTST